MEFLLDSLRADWEAFLRFGPRLVYAVVLFALVYLAGRHLGSIALRVLRRRTSQAGDEKLLRSVFNLIAAGVGLVLALGVLGLQGIAASLIATGGAVAIVLGFAFREIGENFLAGFFLAFSRPFDRGDLILTGGLTGTVVGIALRHVHLRTADACDVFVPSAQIFREPLWNYTRDGLRRPSFTVGVAYQDDPQQVMNTLLTATRAVPDVLPDPSPAIDIAAFSDAVMHYQVMFWIDVTTSSQTLLEVQNAVKAACWAALRDAGMTFSSDVTAGIDVKTAPPLEVEIQSS
jgi:small-conductance mechanosensitive channel